jgi:hypothetical protein
MAQQTIVTTFQFKRGTAARWTELNLILAQGEPGFEYDTNLFKVGDGITPWRDLPYQGEGVEEFVTRSNFNELPEIGKSQILYRVSNEKALYQWNAETQSYEKLSGGGGFDPSTIKIINGGNANGNE